MKVELHNCYIKVIYKLDDTDDNLIKIIKSVNSKFTIKNRSLINGKTTIETRNNYMVKKIDDYKIIYLPRFSCISLLNTYKINYDDKRIKPSEIEYFSNINLYDTQKVICEHIKKKLLKRTNNNFLLCAETGSGKTTIALDLINKLKVKTLIIVPNILLLEQWFDQLLNICNKEDIISWTSKNPDNLLINKKYKIIITTIKTSIKIDVNLINNNNIGLTIYDEVHLYATKTYLKTFWCTQSYYNLALTATPNRIDKFEKIYFQHINIPTYNNEILEINNMKSDKISFSCDVEVIKNDKCYDTELTKSGTVCVANIIENICDDIKRNKIIVTKIIELYDENNENYTFVFSDRRNHLILLAEMVVKERENISILIGGVKKMSVDDAKKNAKVIFTTYQYSSVGLNIPKMNALIFSTPRRNNMAQIIGRILRLSENNEKTRKIIDIWDNASIFKSQFYQRKKIYDLNGYIIKYKVIN